MSHETYRLVHGPSQRLVRPLVATATCAHTGQTLASVVCTHESNPDIVVDLLLQKLPPTRVRVEIDCVQFDVWSRT